MKYFLIDKSDAYTYETLLNDISSSKEYYPQLRTDSLYKSFLNLLLALVTNNPITLIDSDVTVAETEFNESVLCSSKVIDISGFEKIDDLIEKIEKSASEISLYTSGTTGQPKKVIHSLQTLTRNVRKSVAYEDNVWAFAYNPTHMAGLQVFFQAFINSNTLINIFNQNRNDVYSKIEKHSITHISATPTFFRLLLPIEKSFKSVIRVTVGGEKSTGNLYESLKLLFPNAKVNNVYASTEAGSLFAAKGEFFQIPDSIKGKIRFVDHELYIHRSLLGRSEFFNFSDDYYRTGDLVEWENENEGMFRFKGRANELINVGGYKINPSEIESIISEISDVIQVVVYGRQNSVLGNILCADIKLRNNSIVTEFTIRDFLKERLQGFKVPRKIKFVDEILLTRTGKLKR